MLRMIEKIRAFTELDEKSFCKDNELCRRRRRYISQRISQVRIQPQYPVSAGLVHMIRNGRLTRQQRGADSKAIKVFNTPRTWIWIVVNLFNVVSIFDISATCHDAPLQTTTTSLFPSLDYYSPLYRQPNNR